nr:MAG TPA: hypothetical protein [Caudoviricetes sp.]
MVMSFNPRAREGRDSMTSCASLSLEVSIHAPARGATLDGLGRKNIGRFQSTRPRGARLSSGVSSMTTNPVSIHAPARGAT